MTSMPLFSLDQNLCVANKEFSGGGTYTRASVSLIRKDKLNEGTGEALEVISV